MSLEGCVCWVHVGVREFLDRGKVAQRAAPALFLWGGPVTLHGDDEVLG